MLHNHEDNDQSFSSTDNRLQINDAHTLGQLQKQLSEVFNGATTVVDMKHVIHWSGLCEKEKCLFNVSGFSHYCYFKITSIVGPHSTQ